MKKQIIMGSAVLIGGALLLSSCSSIPKNAKAVTPFFLDQYLGNWYEIARFDHRFEKNLDNAAAQYSINKKGMEISRGGS